MFVVGWQIYPCLVFQERVAALLERHGIPHNDTRRNRLNCDNHHKNKKIRHSALWNSAWWYLKLSVLNSECLNKVYFFSVIMMSVFMLSVFYGERQNSVFLLFQKQVYNQAIKVPDTWSYDPNAYVLQQGILQGEVSLYRWPLFDWFELVCFANKNKNCQLSYSWFQTSQTGGQQYSDISPFSIPWLQK